MSDLTPQNELNDFLQAELIHSLGAYRVAAERLDRLDARMLARQGVAGWQALFPPEVLARSSEYNDNLRTYLHKPAHLREDYSKIQAAARQTNGLTGPPRHPAPPRPDAEDVGHLKWVVDFYASSVVALMSADGSDLNSPTPHADRALGDCLAFIHDPQRGGGSGTGRLLSGRLERYQDRLRRACETIALEPRTDRAQEILQDDLSSDYKEALHRQVIGALIEAHMRMHRVEHLQSHSFGDKIDFCGAIDIQSDQNLQYSLVLNTFVYVVGRAAPWIFSEDGVEREYIQQNYPKCCESLTPTYPMWIGHQLSLLALYRRGYTWRLRGDIERAYKDFYKLKRFVRGLIGRQDRRVVKAPGAMNFLNGLHALADHHTGRLYRAQHAHTAALEHFRRAARSLDRLSDEEAREALRNARWRIHLMISQGKTNYEIGLFTRSLLCYVRAWKAFLELTDTESLAKANWDVIDGIIRWLTDIEEDPDLNKAELLRRFGPLVSQFEMLLSPAHLRLLAADIIMRIGHVLAILKLPEDDDESELHLEGGSYGDQAGGDSAVGCSPGSDGVKRIDHRLAYGCLLHARELDPASTLIAADILKIQHWSRDSRVACPLPSARSDGIDIRAQWPAGGGEFEEAARVVEYVLQGWLGASESSELERPSSDKQVARDLLASFLAHTDSSNVKLAQVYRYLMQVSRANESDTAHAPEAESDNNPMVEFVCMRRYSSFFPFLPRPSAFHALGGGYFLRVHDGAPFGIVIDPGPNFVDNLYRCGYCLDDVHMIIVTHDHADHIASLDSLLALLGYRAMLGVDTFTRKHRLVIVGNPSVVARYSFYNTPKRKDAVRVWSFETLYKATIGDTLPCKGDRKVLALPPRLRIEPVETVDHTDAAMHVSQGFLVRVGDAAILFTGDTGLSPSLGGPTPRARVAGVRSFRDALAEATIVVAHISSVPLPEIRRFAELSEPPGSMRKTTETFQAVWQELHRQSVPALAGGIVDDSPMPGVITPEPLPGHEAGSSGPPKRPQQREFLLRQLQFGFHSRIRGDSLAISPLAPYDQLRRPSERHLYLSGLLAIANIMAASDQGGLLLIGELREELGTFRTRIAAALNSMLFQRSPTQSPTRALTTDIGLRLRLTGGKVEILCTTCDLDNDLVDRERFHDPHTIREVCVKGEDEGIFYNCLAHDPQHQREQMWLERVERYNPLRS
jgi:glyoxylase-like metal-dependent hydrolase (beta-lactamase superfamily II)/tetratricopeptide (TPR) repeat protein